MHITEVHDDACTVKVCACAYGLNWRGLYPLARPWRARIIPMIYFLTGPERELYPFMDYSPCWHERHSKHHLKGCKLILSKWGALLSPKLFCHALKHNSDRTKHRDEVGKTQVGKTATLEKFNSRKDCFCKSALWETTSLEHNKFGTFMAPFGHRR